MSLGEDRFPIGIDGVIYMRFAECEECQNEFLYKEGVHEPFYCDDCEGRFLDEAHAELMEPEHPDDLDGRAEDARLEVKERELERRGLL